MSEQPDRYQFEKELAREALRETRSARRWNYVFKSVTLAYVVAVTIWAFSAKDDAPESLPHTAVIDMIGVIDRAGGVSAYPIIEAMETAFNNEAAQAVVLNMDSPGGSPAQSEVIYQNILRLKTEHQKPVVAVVGDICASGCIYIAAAADRVVISKNSMIGNIGVKIEGFGATKLMQKLGVERRTIAIGDHKAMLDPYAEQDPAAVENLRKAVLDVTYQNFVDVVKEGRGDRLKASDQELFNGFVWAGQSAITVGLADEFGDLISVAREFVEDGNSVVYTKKDFRLKDWVFGAAAEMLALHEQPSVILQ